MFDIGWSEMGMILMVALIVIGPKDLPRLAREIGKWTAKARSMAREFQRSFEDMAREADLQDIKSELEKVSRTDMRRQIENTLDPDGSLKRALQAPDLSDKTSDQPKLEAAEEVLVDEDPYGPDGRFVEEDDEGNDAPASTTRVAASGSSKPPPAPPSEVKAVAPAETGVPAKPAESVPAEKPPTPAGTGQA